MTPEIQQLIIILNVGEENAIKSNELNQLLGFQPSETMPVTRDLIREAIADYHVPVGSSNHGYYIIETEEEYLKTIADLKARIGGIQRRIDGITQGWKEKTGVKIQKKKPRAKTFF